MVVNFILQYVIKTDIGNTRRKLMISPTLYCILLYVAVERVSLATSHLFKEMSEHPIILIMVTALFSHYLSLYLLLF